jgi:hypothetical protein
MLIGAGGLLIFPIGAKGEESKVVASAAIRQEYNDNLFFDSQGGKRDFITTVSPGLEWVARMEVLDFSLLGRLDALRYWMSHEFDTVDYNLQSGVQYRLDPRTSFSAAAGSSRDSRPDRDIEVSGLVLGPQARDRWFYTLGGSYLFSEIASLGVQFNQSEDEYNDPDFLDTRGYAGSIFFTRDLGDLLPLLKGKATFAYGQYFYGISETEGYRWTLGGEWAFSEKWNMIVDLGLSRTRSKFQVTTLLPVGPFLVPVSQEEISTTWGGVGQFSLVFRDDATGGGISLQQDIIPASGRGALWSTSLRMYMDQRFTHEIKGGLSASYYYNRAGEGEFSAEEIENHTFNFSAWLRYEFTRDMSIEASYGYAQTLDQVADTEADRSLFLVRFFIQQDLLDLFR